LFYDLVFVVAVGSLARTVHDHVTFATLVGFVGPFVAVWWAWIGYTVYVDRFDSDDLLHRALTGVQMLAVAAMAVNAGGAFGATSRGFAIAYIAVRLLLVVFNLRVWRSLPVARPLVGRYALVYVVELAFWFASLAVPPPWRFVLWGIGLAISLTAPFTARRLQMQLPVSRSHLPERFGLFVLIVIGESIIATAAGFDSVVWRGEAALTATFGFLIAFGLWWTYFDIENVATLSRGIRAPSPRLPLFVFAWLYAHLPLVMAIALCGPAVGAAITAGSGPADASLRWLLCGAVATALLSMAVIEYAAHPSLQARDGGLHVLGRTLAGGAALLLGLGGGGLAPVALTALLALLCLLQIVVDTVAGRWHVDEHEPAARVEQPAKL
jgi:low temperature requirement protein LtrA